MSYAIDGKYSHQRGTIWKTSCFHLSAECENFLPSGPGSYQKIEFID